MFVSEPKPKEQSVGKKRTLKNTKYKYYKEHEHINPESAKYMAKHREDGRNRYAEKKARELTDLMAAQWLAKKREAGKANSRKRYAYNKENEHIDPKVAERMKDIREGSR